MKKYNAIFYFILFSFLLVSCDFSPKNRDKNKDYPHLTPKEILNDKEDKYKWEKVYIEGIVSMPSEQTLEAAGVKSGSYDIILTHENGDVYPNVKINIGDSLNRMKPIPESYTADDLVIQDKNGKIIKVGDKVRVMGTVEPFTTINFETGGENKHYFISAGILGEIEKL